VAGHEAQVIVDGLGHPAGGVASPWRVAHSYESGVATTRTRATASAGPSAGQRRHQRARTGAAAGGQWTAYVPGRTTSSPTGGRST